MALSSKDFINQVRELTRDKYHGFYDQVSDQKAYEMGKARYPDIDVEPYKELPSQSVKQVDTSPKVLNEEGNWLTNTALNDHIVDEDSYMAHKMAYNNSITGLAYKFHKGVDKYPEVQRALETGEYDPGVLEEAYSMLFGFTFPLDIATFAASAGAGKLAQLGAVSMLKNGLIKKGITTDIGVSVASSMANMGTFIGAQNTVAEMAHQSEEINKGQRDEYDEFGIMKATGQGFLEGAALGAAIGGVTGGFAASRAKLNKAARGKRIYKGMGGTPKGEVSNQIGRLVASKPMEFSAETGTFTLGHYALHGAPKKEDGSMDWDGFIRDIFLNTTFLGGMKAATWAVGKPYKDYKKFQQKAREEFLKEATTLETEGALLESQLNQSEGRGAKKDVIDAIKEAIVENKQKKAELKGFDKWEKDFLELTELMESLPKNPTSKDIQALLDKRPNFGTEFLLATHGYLGVLEVLKRSSSRKSSLDKIVNQFPELSIDKVKELTSSHYDNKIKEVVNSQTQWNKLELRLKSDPAYEPTITVSQGVLKYKNLLELPLTEIKKVYKEYVGKKAPAKKSIDELAEMIWAERARIEHKEKTKLGEDVVSIKDTDKFAKTELEVPKGVEGDAKKRIKKLSKIDKEISEDTGGFSKGEIDAGAEGLYSYSKKIVRHFIQNVFPDLTGKTLGKTTYLKSAYRYSTELNSYAKWLAKRGKNFATMENADMKLYLRNNTGHVTALQKLREFVQQNNIINPTRFSLTQTEVASAARKLEAAVPKGVTKDTHKLDKDGITYVPSKHQAAGPITKYISTKLRKLWKSITSKTTGDYLFTDINGKAITNKELNAFVDHIFGDKGLTDKARLFRDSMTSWAGEKYGPDSRQDKIIRRWILGQRGDKLTAAYNKASHAVEAKELVQKYIKEISRGTEKDPSKEYYNTYEISEGLKNIAKEKGNITFKVGEKEVSISKDMAEALARYMIETSPRVNEIVPTKAPKVETKTPKDESKRSSELSKYIEEKSPNLTKSQKQSFEQYPESTVTKLIKEDIKKAKNKSEKANLEKLLNEAEIEYIKMDIRKKEKSLSRKKDFGTSMRLNQAKIDLKKLEDLNIRFRKGERPKSEIELKTEGERRGFLDWVKKKFNFNDKNLQEIESLGDGRTWGQYYDGVIKLAKGKWQPVDFFHELTHFHEAYVRKTGDLKGIKLYEQLDRLVTKSEAYKNWQKNNPDKDSVEFYTDKVAFESIKNQKAKGIGSRFVRWLKNFKSHVMSKFLGGRFATQKDISRVLAKKLESFSKRDMVVDMTGTAALIGGERATSQIIRYKKGDSTGANKFKDLSKFYHALQNRIIQRRMSLGENKKDIQIDLRSEREKVTGHKDWREGNVPNNLIEFWTDHLRNTNADVLIGEIKPPKNLSSKDKNSWLKSYRLYEKNAFDWISNKTEVQILQDLVGVKNGDIRNAKPSQIEELIGWARQIGDRPKNSSNTNNVIISAQINKDVKWGKLKSYFMTHIPPVWYTARKMGATKLSKKMLDHTITELSHIGRASLAETKMLGLLGKFNKDIDRLSVVVDKERFFERLDKKLFTDKELKLAKAIFKNVNRKDKTRELRSKEVEKIIDGKKKKVTEYETPQAEAYAEFVKLRDYYWNEAKKIAWRKYKVDGEITRAQYDRFLEDFSKKWVTDYFPRKVTKDFIKHYDPSTKWMKDVIYGKKVKGVRQGGLIEKEAKKQVDEMEYKKGETFKKAKEKATERGDESLLATIEDAYAKKIVEIKKDPDIELIAKMELENLFEFNPQTVRNRYLFKRGVKLPEITKVETSSGRIKNIETYEKNYAETMGSYARTMSKFLATAQEYPEFTPMMRKYGFPMAKVDIVDRRAQNYVHADWLLRRAKDQMGLGSSELATKPLTATLQSVATATSKLALSFPTAGIKNIVVGTPQTVAAFGLFRTIGAMHKWTQAEARARAAEIGAKDLGTRPLEEMKTWRLLEYPFKLSLMKPTETFNRITAMYAGRSTFEAALANYKKAINQKQIVKGIKDFWHLSDKEIYILDKFGLDPTANKKINEQMSRVSTKLNEVVVKDIITRAINKIDSWSHINTQGGTTSVLQPYWFNKPMAKPFLLFQRMAYAATFNLTQNVIKPMNLTTGRRNVLPLVRYLGTSLAGGYGLMSIYDHFLGVQPPKANDSKWNQLMVYLWKAEMLGLFSENLSPFQSRDNINTSLYPAIWKNGILLYDSFNHVIDDKKTFGQAFEDTGKGIISAWNQMSKILHRKNNKYNDEYLRTKRLLKDFKEEREIEEPVIDFISNRSKYYRDFRNNFNKNTPKEAAKKFLSAYFSITDSFLKEGYTIKGAHKQAKAIMKSQIKNLNPNNLSAKKGNRVISMKQDFLNWLKPGVGKHGNKKLYDMVVNAEKQYYFKWREVQKEIAKLIKERGLESFSNIKHTPRKVIL